MLFFPILLDYEIAVLDLFLRVIRGWSEDRLASKTPEATGVRIYGGEEHHDAEADREDPLVDAFSKEWYLLDRAHHSQEGACLNVEDLQEVVSYGNSKSPGIDAAVHQTVGICVLIPVKL